MSSGVNHNINGANHVTSYAPGIKRGSGLMEGWGNWAKISPAPAQSGHRPVVMGPGLLCTGTRGLRLQTSLPGFLASVVLRHPQRDTVRASDINAVIQRKKGERE